MLDCKGFILKATNITEAQKSNLEDESICCNEIKGLWSVSMIITFE
jgi:hypothetical protein